MTLLNNQFAMSTVLGDLDLQFPGGVITGRVSPNQATALVAGQPVKIDSASTGGVIPLLALAANTDSTFGFVIRTLKDQSFPTNAAVEIAIQGAVMQMNAGAAITRGAKVEVVQSTPGNVITSAGTNPVVGFALDEAAGAGSLLRVYILTPAITSAQTISSVSGLQAALNTKVQTTQISVTQAQLNAGQVLVPGVAGEAITVVDIQAAFTGTWAVGTAMVIESTNATPVVVATETVAGMTGFIRVPNPNDTHQTIGAGAGVALGTGDGLQVVHTGSAFTGGTAVNFLISYVQQ